MAQDDTKSGNTGNTGDDTTRDAKSQDGYISKADHEKNMGELKQQLDDMRLEIMTPEYIAFLESAGTKKEEKREPAKQDDSTVDYSKLTTEQIVKLATEKARAESAEEVKRLRDEFSSRDNDAVKKEIASFARVTPDYERFRPLMYGLARDPKNADLSLKELYDKAKDYVKGFGPSDDDKSKSRRSSNERPGGGSNSVIKEKKYTADEAAEEAWNEVVGNDGLPTT